MPEVYVGLISGTSMDGIDAVVADFSSRVPTVMCARTYPFSDSLKTQLQRLRDDPEAFPAGCLGRLDAELGAALAEAARAILEESGIRPEQTAAVGSHGQTVVHRPDSVYPYSLQIGDPARIAAATGILTVADFRRADLAAGGQGGPLAPLLHAALFGSARESRAVVNLGGIANVSLLPAGTGAVTGFDTGPANCFLDLWYRRHHEGRFDAAGEWASGGRVDSDWLRRLLEEPYFGRPAPKSTGIEYFSPAWLEARLPDWAASRPRDIQATIAELTAATVARALTGPGSPERVFLCGGGIHNRDLAARLKKRLPGIPVESTAAVGLDPDFIEALLFAWLARERLSGQAVDTRPITGARHPVMLGAVHSVAPGGRETRDEPVAP